MKKLLLLVILALFSTPVLAAEKKLKVVASFSILGDMVANVGGDKITLKTLVGANSDVHVYQPSPLDAKQIADADLVIINGLNFEGWIARLVGASGYKGKVIAATNGIKPRQLAGEGDDPHAWHDMANARVYVANIRDALAAADPENAAVYKANAAKYLAEIAQTEKFVKDEFAKIPPEKRVIITSHDAFGYYGAAYGVRFLAPLGLNTDSEASAKDIAKLIDQIRANKVKVVYIENISDPRLIKQISHDSGATVGGELYSDALSAKGGAADSYLKLMRYNTSQLVSGLVK